MAFVVTKFTSSNFHHALKLVLRGTGSGLYLHPTKASRFLYVRQRLKQSRGLCLPFCLSDANIRENWYPNVVLSGRQPCSNGSWNTWKGTDGFGSIHDEDQKNELPDGNIIVSPNVSVVKSFRTGHLSTLQRLWWRVMWCSRCSWARLGTEGQFWQATCVLTPRYGSSLEKCSWSVIWLWARLLVSVCRSYCGRFSHHFPPRRRW